MIFSPDELLELAGKIAAELGVPVPVDSATMRAIVEVAEQCAAGRETDEPAALFYASALQAVALGKLAASFLGDIADAQADAVGLALAKRPRSRVSRSGPARTRTGKSRGTKDFKSPASAIPPQGRSTGVARSRRRYPAGDAGP